MRKVDEDVNSTIFYYQSKIPVSLLEIGSALGVHIQIDPNEPLKKAGKGKSCARLVLYPRPVIYYSNDIGSTQKIKFIVATILSYYILYKDMIIQKLPHGDTESVFYDHLWNKEIGQDVLRRKALKYAADILVPPHMLKKIFKDDAYANNLEKIAKYFDVQPSLISIATGMPYEQ